MLTKLPAKAPDAQGMADLVRRIMGWGEDGSGTFAHVLVASQLETYPAEDWSEILDSFKETVLEIMAATKTAGRA